MSNKFITRYYVYWENDNQYIKIFIDSDYTGNIGVKIVGVVKCLQQAL